MEECTKCHQPLAAGAEFCGKCGSTLSRDGFVCQMCGCGIEPGETFCDGCGAPLDWTTITERAQAAQAARTEQQATLATLLETPHAENGASAVSEGGRGTMAAAAVHKTGSENGAASVVSEGGRGTMAAAAAQSTLRARFIVAGPHGREVIPFIGKELLFGRLDRPARIFPDLQLDDKAASRRHLAIFLEGDKLCAQDLESVNGTLLNHRPMPPGQVVELRHGDAFKIGEQYLVTVEIKGVA